MMMSGDNWSHFKYWEDMSWKYHLADLRPMHDELRNELDANNAKLFIVIPPFTKVYLQGVDLRYIDDFCERTNTLDGFIDCNKFLSYGDELFIDTDHLNDVGAVRFTENLKMLMSNVSMSTIS